MVRFLLALSLAVVVTTATCRADMACKDRGSTAHWPAVGGPAVRGYQLSLEGPTQPVGGGRSIPIRVTLRNVSGAAGYLPYTEPLGVIIVNAAGEQVATKLDYTSTRYIATNYALNRPCHAHAFNRDLAAWAHLSPGTYAVSAVFYANYDVKPPDSQFIVVSNPIVITVR